MSNVLVTGASRGIGRAIATRLALAGWDVFAAVRDEADAPPSPPAAGAGRIAPVRVDITDSAQIAALDAVLPSRLDALVNNAGIVVGGPVEALSLEDLRRQLEVNVVGQAAITQRLLPRLRAAQGRIVFISSVSGRVATPMTGAYNASKFALEGLADAMRLELAPWGIRVAIVEPAQTDTDMWRSAEEELERTIASISPEHRELYAKHIKGFRRSIPRSQKMAVPASNVAAAVERALSDRRPRARYVVGRGPLAQVLLAQIVPTRVFDRVLQLALGVPRRA